MDPRLNDFKWNYTWCHPRPSYIEFASTSFWVAPCLLESSDGFMNASNLDKTWPFCTPWFCDVFLSVMVLVTGTMVLSAVCHDSCNMIAALADGKFTVWYYPNAVFVDKDLLAQTVYEKGKCPITTW